MTLNHCAKQTCLPLRAFSLLLLVPLICLLLGGSGLLIHQARQIMSDGSHTYGQYKATESFLARTSKVYDQLWLLASVRDSKHDAAAWDRCCKELQALAMENQRLGQSIKPHLASLNRLKAIRLQEREISAKLLQSQDQANLLLSQSRLELLEKEAESALQSLSKLTKDLLVGGDAAQELSAILKKQIVDAQFMENCVLLMLLITLSYLAALIALGLAQVVRPLEAIRGYVGQLGTGVKLPSLVPSRVKVIAEIGETLENLGIYLGQATVASEKMESERSQFKRMSLYDGLTGLYNRRAFDQLLDKLWQAARDQQTPLGIVMMDVDKFKVYNDSLGHQAGDTCLREVAKAVAKAVRGNDVAARYGGEEFVVILPDTDQSQALACAERIRTSVERVKLPHPGSPTGPYVTISLGVTSELVDGAGQALDLVHHADAALYLSKENGRNRATLFDASTTSKTS
ncbi:MAG: GGDEF domain-containing protein [Desulfovibrio sp.]|nr:GGDEF domain-containing protein [Desulfovibrio sp.]